MAQNSEEKTDLEVSEVIDNTKKISDIGPLKALLTPASELLGQKLKDAIERWFEKKASSNLLGHARSVERNRTLDSLSEQAQMDLFGSAAQAGKIAPSETELSAAVRASLESTIDENRSDASLLLELTREEILYLIGERRGVDAVFTKINLKSKGLLRTESIFETLLSAVGIPGRYVEHVTTFRWTAAFLFGVAAILLPTALITLPMSMALAVSLQGVTADGVLDYFLGISNSLINVMVYLASASLVGFLFFVPTRTNLTPRGNHFADLLSKYLSDF